jgi:hypothetical protein
MEKMRDVTLDFSLPYKRGDEGDSGAALASGRMCERLWVRVESPDVDDVCPLRDH